MKRSRFKGSQIVSILKDADAGAKIKELGRKYGISDAKRTRIIVECISDHLVQIRVVNCVRP